MSTFPVTEHNFSINFEYLSHAGKFSVVRKNLIGEGVNDDIQ